MWLLHPFSSAVLGEVRRILAQPELRALSTTRDASHAILEVALVSESVSVSPHQQGHCGLCNRRVQMYEDN